MGQPTGVSRRVFLKRSAQVATATVAAPCFLPSCSSGVNEKIQIGIIGLGRRFHEVINPIPKDRFAIVAFCDVYDTRLESAKTKFNKDAATYKDYRDMLVADDIDAVVVSAPDHWHALLAIEACKAGKDVYVEKPLALTIAEGRAMVKAARETGRIMQVGTQQRSRDVCMQGCQAVLDHTIGKVTEVHCANYPSPWDCDIAEAEEVPKGLDWSTWLGQTPPRPYHQEIYNVGPNAGKYPDGRPRGWPNYKCWSGGVMTAWGAHGLDTVMWALGKQRSGTIEICPERTDETVPVRFLLMTLTDNSWKEGHALTCPVHFKYADGTKIHLDGKGPGFGGLFVGGQGTIMVDRDVLQTKRSGEEMTTVREPFASGDGTAAHMNHWFECIKSRTVSRADVEVAHQSCTLCHLGNIARWVGRKIVWDPETETFGDDEEANSYISREARAPWAVV